MLLKYEYAQYREEEDMYVAWDVLAEKESTSTALRAIHKKLRRE